MATRCRDKYFMQQRELSKAHRPPRPSRTSGMTELTEFGSDKSNLLSDTSDSCIVEVTPSWAEHVKEIEGTLQQVKIKMAELAKNHKNHLLFGFDDSREADQEAQIKIQTAEITRLFHLCQKHIKSIGMEGIRLTKEQEGVVVNVKAKLAGEVQQLSSEFRKSQQTYLQRLKGYEEGTAEAFGDEEEFDFADPGMTDEQLAQIDTLNIDTQGRSKALKDIHHSIVELSEIFKDMALLVVDQGTVLDRIDYNIEQTEIAADEGLGQLREAHENEGKSRMKKCILLLVVMIMVVVLVIFLKATVKFLVF